MPIKPKIDIPKSFSADHSAKNSFLRFFSIVNVPLLLIVAAITALGLLIVYSATQNSDDFSFTHQLLGLAIGVAFMLLLWRIDFHRFEEWVIPLLIITFILILMPLLPFIGIEAKGARSWISLFGQRMQPAEPAKILTIIIMAALVGKYRGKLNSGRDYAKCLIILLAILLAILLQPDFGTGMVLFAIGITILVTGGAHKKWLLISLIAIIAIFVTVFTLDPILDKAFNSDVLIQDYQVNRLLVFLDEDLDPDGAGWNLMQSKIAIGSGGMFGKGYMEGTQSGLGFLPEAPTDFIFCVLAEEMGFVGAGLLILLFVILILICFWIAFKADDTFGTLVVMGVIGMWAFQIIENIGMTCGMMPITGIPLPFISYGSSSMVTNFMAVGLVLSVWTHRYGVRNSNMKVRT